MKSVSNSSPLSSNCSKVPDTASCAASNLKYLSFNCTCSNEIFCKSTTSFFSSLSILFALKWNWARTRDKACHDPIPIPLGYRGHSSRLEEIGGLGIPLRSLWLTRHYRRVAGVSPLLSIGWWYLFLVAPRSHCYRVRAADKWCRVFPLDPRPDAVALYSGCTPGKRCAWFLPDDRHTASLVGLRGGWRHAWTKMFTCTYGSNAAVPRIHVAVVSEPDLLGTPDTEILEGFSDQGVTHVTKPSTISTTTQTDLNITNIICPPLHYLKPVSSENPMPSTSYSESTASTSSSSTQKNLLPSPSAIIPTIQSESLSKIPIPTTTTTTSPVNNLNTSVSSLEPKSRSVTTPNKFAALSTEIQPLVPLSESVPTTSNREHSNAPEIPQCVKRNSRNRRKRRKVQKPEIEIKMAPHRPRKSAPTEYATDEEYMITYYVVEKELLSQILRLNAHLKKVLQIILNDIYAR
ncbi:uncharacterized protein TNCV_2239971 [Trichonephila clavipes]|nr:uncharacterized protein TNCV_2239971 [Trichonephila clavipes]